MNYVEELLKSLYVMASLVEARDPYTGGHLWRVSQFSRVLATSAGLPVRDVARIALGGFLHDLGKIGVPDAILNKTDRLTDEEYAVIKTHPEVGHRLLSGHPLALLANDAVLAHHERPDGLGYPYQLTRDQISIDARIVGIADAFDAMTSTRPYRRGMPVEKALRILEECAGTQFDAVLTHIFTRLGVEGQLDHIIGHSDLGIPMQDCPECGPIIVVRRDQKAGDRVYCRNCGYKTYVMREHGRISIADTDEHGTAEELQPEIDIQLIQELVVEAASILNHAAE
jgi:ribosomal protein S27AE